MIISSESLLRLHRMWSLDLPISYPSKLVNIALYFFMKKYHKIDHVAIYLYFK